LDTLISDTSIDQAVVASEIFSVAVSFAATIAATPEDEARENLLITYGSMLTPAEA